MELRRIVIVLTCLFSLGLFVSPWVESIEQNPTLKPNSEHHSIFDHHHHRSEVLSSHPSAQSSTSSSSSSSENESSSSNSDLVSSSAASSSSSSTSTAGGSYHSRLLRNVARLRTRRAESPSNTEYSIDDPIVNTVNTILDATTRGKNMKSTFVQFKQPGPHPHPHVPIVTEQLDLDALIPPGYDKLMPPKENGLPTKVRFHVWVLGLDSINEGSMTYVADIFMSQSWKDSRLLIPRDIAFNVNASADPRGPYRLLPVGLIDRIWRPDSFFKNAKEVTFQEMTIPNHYIWLYADHTILYMVKLSLLLSCAMKFQSYPHDTQNCSMKIESLSYTNNDLIFDWEESEPLVVEDHIELPQHDLVYRDIDYCTTVYSSGTFSCVQVNFTIKRRLGYYIFHTYIPTCLIVVMSWISFWIRPEAVPARVTLCVTSLLTMSTQHAQSQKSLPPVSYIKAIDIFMSSCTVFVFASLMEYALVNILMSDDPVALNSWSGSPLPLQFQAPHHQQQHLQHLQQQQQQQNQQQQQQHNHQHSTNNNYEKATNILNKNNGKNLSKRKCEDLCCSLASGEQSLSGPPPSCSSSVTSADSQTLSAPWIDCEPDVENYAPMPAVSPTQTGSLDQLPVVGAQNTHHQSTQQPLSVASRTLQLQRKNNQNRNGRSMIQFEQLTGSAQPKKSALPAPSSSIDPLRIGVHAHCHHQKQHSSPPHQRTVNGASQHNCFDVTSHSHGGPAQRHQQQPQAHNPTAHHVNGVRLRRLSHSWSLLRVLNRTHNPSECSRNKHKGSHAATDIDSRTPLKCHFTSTNAMPNKSDSPCSSHSDFWHNRLRAHSLSAGLYPQQHHRALFVDKISRWIFPLSFIVLNILYWTYYLELLHAILPSSLADNLPSLF